MSESAGLDRPGWMSSATPVALRVHADLGLLPLLRATAETVAVLADFDLDSAADVKMAVDEVCSELIGAAVGDLACSYDIVGDGLRVRIDAVTGTDTVPDEQGFGWHVLTILTDSLRVTRAATHDPLRHRTTIEFTKARHGGA